ncbi:hypothetical protein LOAG_08252 [Loa loa]|uniref:Uncharacterized protein n=1 Tax=Loa loa TaxID=7209 RepID=A0A1S0TTY3_LOALO|nr:hypothetical protein LOAG_08252 [Loa loa]EFO20238.1 hypothetical protein LOAG_08252 [Loa loa]
MLFYTQPLVASVLQLITIKSSKPQKNTLVQTVCASVLGLILRKFNSRFTEEHDDLHQLFVDKSTCCSTSHELETIASHFKIHTNFTNTSVKIITKKHFGNLIFLTKIQDILGLMKFIYKYETATWKNSKES